MTETFSDSLDIADDHGMSYMHFGYKWYSNWTWDNPGHFKNNGYDTCINRNNISDCLIEDSVKTFARTYPKAIAGTKIKY